MQGRAAPLAYCTQRSYCHWWEGEINHLPVPANHLFELLTMLSGFLRLPRCSFRTTYFTFRQTDLSTAAAWTWRPAKPRTGPQLFGYFGVFRRNLFRRLIIYFADRFCFAEDYMDILGGHLHGPVFSTLNSFKRSFCTFWDSGLDGSIYIKRSIFV